MNFSPEWEKTYQENNHQSIWPWSNLVSLVMRHSRPHGSDFKVLELGCGAGANINFFKHLQSNYFAMDGSATIIDSLKKRFPEYAPNLTAGDFTQNIPFEENFDLIGDRAALTHNSTQAIRSGLELSYNRLKPGGHFIAVDWFSTEHSEFKRGQPGADNYTRKNFEAGPFAHLGSVHFFDQNHLLDLFGNFKIKILEKVCLDQLIPESKTHLVTWNIVAQKEI